jgi:hypothetical protein
MYAFSMNEKASAIIRVEKIDEAIKKFSDNEIQLLKASELYSI